MHGMGALAHFGHVLVDQAGGNYRVPAHRSRAKQRPALLPADGRGRGHGAPDKHANKRADTYADQIPGARANGRADERVGDTCQPRSKAGVVLFWRCPRLFDSAWAVLLDIFVGCKSSMCRVGLMPIIVLFQ